MEVPTRHEPEPDQAMRKRVRNAGIVSIGALATVGGIGIGQAATAERQPGPPTNQPVSAEDLHMPRAGGRHNEPATEVALESGAEKEQNKPNLEPAIWWPVGVKQNWLAIQSVANEYMVDPYLVATIVAEESMGQNVHNPSGAEGLMQIMPSTAQEIARLRHRAYYNMQDINQNLDFGCWLIHYLDEKYIKARGVDINSEMGIAMLAVYYGDGEGAGEVWARNGYSQVMLSDQAKHVIPLWSDMYKARNSEQNTSFTNTRGK